MLEDQQTSIINLLNSYIICESNLNHIFLQEIFLKNSSNYILMQLFKGKILQFLIFIIIVKMIDFHTNKLDSFFSEIKESIFCGNCLDNLSQLTEMKSKCMCLFSENNKMDLSEDCIDANNEEIISIFHNMIDILYIIYEKENLFLKKFHISEKFSILNEIKLKYVHLIKLVLKIYLKNLLQNFKQNFNLSESNCQINKNYLSLLIELEIYEIYQETLKQIVKQKVNKKIGKLSRIHEKPILNDIISIFRDLFLQWANKNVKDKSSILKEEFELYIKKSYLKIKTDYFFEILTNYPESHHTLIDLRMCLDECKAEQNEFILQIKSQISTRLLTPGIATPLIIEILIRLIRIMKILDSSNFLLEIISQPIKNYLRQRKDTMRWIITTILSEEDDTLKQDLGKQYIKTSHINIMKSNREKDEFDFLSSDEDEAAAENWEPLPLNNGLINEMTNKSKFSDIISSLVNIFGSPEKFIEQYKRMLAERCVSDTNFSIENEIKNLELLKIKFGEHMFQGCDIIIKDVKDSLKINNSVKILMNRNIRSNEFELNNLIINKNFWPFKEEKLFNLDELSKSTQNEFKFLKLLKDKLENYKKLYSSLKFSRTLNLYSNIGYVELTLTFENGTFEFRVTPLAAIIINLYDDKIKFEKFTVEYISEILGCNSNDVKKKLNFWVNVGVLSENSNRLNTINDNNFNDYEENQIVYYEPNKILKNYELNNNQIIDEEDIYKFEYVEMQSTFNLENAVCSILKNSGPKNFEQLYKNIVLSYQINISEIKLREILGKLILDQKIFKEGEFYKLLIYTV